MTTTTFVTKDFVPKIVHIFTKVPTMNVPGKLPPVSNTQIVLALDYK
jgi:hypothetical protein